MMTSSRPCADPQFQAGVLCHIAIPAVDLDASEHFYTRALGARLFRSYPDRRTYGLANLQIVTHRSSPEQVLWNPGIYPRHFGITFSDAEWFEAMVQSCLSCEVPVVLERQYRFEGRPEQHLTFIVRDPAHNLVELKHYLDAQMAF